MGIIFLMWELGQPYKMFPHILKLAHFLFERGGVQNSGSQLAVLGVIAAQFQPLEAPELLRAKQPQRTPSLPFSFCGKTQRSREVK